MLGDILHVQYVLVSSHYMGSQMTRVVDTVPSQSLLQFDSLEKMLRLPSESIKQVLIIVPTQEKETDKYWL